MDACCHLVHVGTWRPEMGHNIYIRVICPAHGQVKLLQPKIATHTVSAALPRPALTRTSSTSSAQMLTPPEVSRSGVSILEQALARRRAGFTAPAATPATTPAPAPTPTSAATATPDPTPAAPTPAAAAVTPVALVPVSSGSGEAVGTRAVGSNPTTSAEAPAASAASPSASVVAAPAGGSPGGSFTSRYRSVGL